ncbi:MAG: PAS domain-containing sensor histidine kinase, partial [Gemmatimonadales bacterium]
GRILVETIDTTRLSQPERVALERHAASLNEALSRVKQASVYSRFYTGALALMLLLFGAVVIYASIRLGGHLSRQLSRPIEELIGWTEHIQRHEPLPEDRPRRGAPEFAALRQALRGMAGTLEESRARDLEAERLRAFREVARRVAHEMKNPLTPIRIAVAQLQRTVGAGSEALDVIAAESARLEHLAREFADLGRMPEGPAAEVDLAELVGELARTSLPPEVEGNITTQPGLPRITGHYDPLRRALGNLIRNAVEAMNGTGRIDFRLTAHDGGVEVQIADHGPGIGPEQREHIFEPYYTSKQDGTGLGLTLVRQAVEAHGGTVRAGETPGGGATFALWLPASASPAAPASV